MYIYHYCKLYGTIHSIFYSSQSSASSHSILHNSDTFQPSEIPQILLVFSDDLQSGSPHIFLFHSPKFSKIFLAPWSCYWHYL